MHDAAESSKVEWRPWGADAFEAAAESGTPVLVSLSAYWCGWCREMDEQVFDHPVLAANVNDDFVPVRVDADAHPRVRERYNMGGFPSTVFCTPDGDVMSGTTYLDGEGFRQVLERVRDTWDEKGAEAGRIPRALSGHELPAGPVTGEIERLVAGQLDDKFDADHAGWGTAEKFPLPRTVEFALKRERTQATRTLDAIRANLFDDADGGFYRYGNERDWSDPQREKLLDVNAALLRAYAHGYLNTGDDTYRDTAARTIDYLTETLWTGDYFAGSQAPSDYYGLSATERAGVEEPPVDDRVFAEKNALAADALCWFAAYTDEDRARRYAERTLAYLDRELVADDGTVSHVVAADAEQTGLLTDQAAVLQLLTSAAQVLGEDYLERAETVADRTLELRQGDADSEAATGSATSALRDGPVEGVGLLDRPLYPIDDNALVADALVDLHHLTEKPGYLETARDVLGAFAGAADRMGVQIAGYATASARVVDRPLVVAVADDPWSDLHRAALRMADHEKVVVPDADGEPGTAWLSTADGPTEPVESPQALADLVSSWTENA